MFLSRAYRGPVTHHANYNSNHRDFATLSDLYTNICMLAVSAPLSDTRRVTVTRYHRPEQNLLHNSYQL